MRNAMRMKSAGVIGLLLAALVLMTACGAEPAKTQPTPAPTKAPTAEPTQAPTAEPAPAFQDRTLICKDCGGEFLFTSDEQAFYAEKGFQNEPSRCMDCRQARKNSTPEPQEKRGMTAVICSGCGNETQVPFVPNGRMPVYCSDCFRGINGSAGK